MPISPHAQHLASRLRPRSRRQYVMSVAVLAALIAAVGYVMLGRASSATAQATTATAATGTYQQTVGGTGTIEPARQADLDFTVSGRVTSVDVEAGDTVKKGEVLAKLDTVSLDATLASAKAQLEAAETTAADDASETSTRRASNDAALASAQADVAQAEDDLDAATLKATFAGTVAAVSVAVGDQAGSSSSSSAASAAAGAGQSGTTGGTASSTATSSTTAAITVIKASTFVVDVDVAAADITNVKKGLQAQITPAGATDPIFGTVEDVGRVAETGTSGTATFPVTVAVTGTQKDLYAGTTAEVSIIVKQVQDVLTVPSQALTTTGGKTYVTVSDGSSTKKTAVTVGETYGMSTEITKGLVAGDAVEIPATGRARTGGGTSTGGNEQQRGGDGGFPAGGTLPGGGAGGFPGGNQ